MQGFQDFTSAADSQLPPPLTMRSVKPSGVRLAFWACRPPAGMLLVQIRGKDAHGRRSPLSGTHVSLCHPGILADTHSGDLLSVWNFHGLPCPRVTPCLLHLPAPTGILLPHEGALPCDKGDCMCRAQVSGLTHSHLQMDSLMHTTVNKSQTQSLPETG